MDKNKKQSVPKNDVKKDESDDNFSPTNDIAPHYDTQKHDLEPNTSVEISKGSIDETLETDQRPR